LTFEGLFDAIYARGPVPARLGGRAWLVAMLDVAAALVRPWASEGLIAPLIDRALVVSAR
jgi:hypothetical protein